MLKLTPKTKHHIKRILPFGIIWLVTGLVFLYIEYAATGGQSMMLESAIKLDFRVLLFATLGVTMVGMFVGFIELVFIKSFFDRHRFIVKIFYKFLLYTLLFSVIMFIMFMIAASIELKLSVFDAQVWDKYVSYLFSITHLSTLVQLGFSLLLSLIYAEISEHLGENVLYNFFTGKYHKPIVEQRLFMFTDMYASTTIAEQLGSVTYFEFLRCYYNDLSEAIIKHYGEVYQYIGDEIVISWNLNNPEAYNYSVRCFFAMKHDLKQKQNWYLQTFGFYPDFKGAIHCGEVTTGEIGALKKEIFFTGDVLNTTARIQALCTTYDTDLLLSEAVVSHWKATSDLECKRLDAVSLKGKTKTLTLYTISKRMP